MNTRRTPEIAGSRDRNISSAVMKSPCRESEILQKKRAPRTARSTPCAARTTVAAKMPLAVTRQYIKDGFAPRCEFLQEILEQPRRYNVKSRKRFVKNQ
jgi:hypothetical protein